MKLLASKPILAALAIATACFLFSSRPTQAASINVVTGNDELSGNSNCSLSEAIANVNNGNADTYPECTGTGSYGTDDTIYLPVGTITLTADIPEIQNSVKIAGQGMNASIIDGDSGQYQGFTTATIDTMVLERFKIKAFAAFGFLIIDANLEVNQVEVDGTGAVATAVPFSSGADVIGGLRYMNNTAVTSVVNIDTLYIHDLQGGEDAVYVGGLSVSLDNGASVGVVVQNTTISNLVSNSVSGSPQVHAVDLASTPGSSFDELLLKNMTIGSVSSDASAIASGISLGGFSFNQGAHSKEATLQNITINDFTALQNQYSAAALLLVGGAAAETDTVNLNMNLSNVLISKSTASGVSQSCLSLDASSYFEGVGTVTGTFSSQGGNLSDDNSCSSYFTQPTDQNNLTNLASTLSPLADNGGFVPTMALLQGSPAIDSGVTVSGLTTDARQATRPQGTAYDSGAYESPYSKATASLAGTGEGVAVLRLLGTLLIILGSIIISGYNKRTRRC